MNSPVCEKCAQPIARLERPWTANTVNGEFRSDWANPFGFPWCPGKGSLTPHTPRTTNDEEMS